MSILSQITLGLWLVFSVHKALAASESPTDDGMLYYKIGGGRHVSVPPSLKITTLDLSVYAGSLNGACSDFDPVVSIKSSLEQLKDGKDNAINALESAAGAAIANLPGYLLQKANPGLYDLFQNALLRAQTSFSIATKSCERVQHEMSQNINPYAEWVTLSQGEAWQHSIGWGEENVHQAENNVKNAGRKGIPWVGGHSRGGVGQPPIQVRGDIAAAGLNLIEGRATESHQTREGGGILQTHFPTPDSVKAWVLEVLGDEHITVCEGCQKGSVPGRGLMPLIAEKSVALEGELQALVEQRTKPTGENLDRLSAPGLVITGQVIQALQQQTPSEQTIFIGKLAQEIAQARTIEQALIVRRLLLTGAKEGHVAAISMAQESVDRAVTELDQEVQQIVLEQQVREGLVSDTVMALLRYQKAQQETSLKFPATQRGDSSTLRDGSVPHD